MQAVIRYEDTPSLAMTSDPSASIRTRIIPALRTINGSDRISAAERRVIDGFGRLEAWILVETSAGGHQNDSALEYPVCLVVSPWRGSVCTSNPN
jgi:hypothetical protein